MVKIAILGSLTVSGAASGLAGKTRRLGILIYLLLRGPSAREHLQSVFWPEKSARLARKSLNQSLVILRRELPPGALRTDGPMVAVASEAVVTDVDAFRAAVSAGAHADAVALYRGPLLDGVHLDSTEPFEEWIEGERQQLARAASRASEQWIETALSQQDAATLIAAVEAALRIGIPDQRILARAIQWLAAAGRRSEAERIGSANLRRFRTEVGSAPPIDVERLLGDPDLVLPDLPAPQPEPAGVTPERSDPAAAPQPQPAPSPIPRGDRRVRAPRVRAVAVAAALAGLTMIGWFLRPYRSEAGPNGAGNAPQLSVFAEDPSDRASVALANEVATRLAEANFVVSRRDSGQTSVRLALRDATIGRDAVVQLVDPVTGNIVAAERIAGNRSTMAAAVRVARWVRKELGTRLLFVDAQGSPAYIAELRRARDLAADGFRMIDSRGYSAALSLFAAADSAAVRALRLQPDLAEAYITRAALSRSIAEVSVMTGIDANEAGKGLWPGIEFARLALERGGDTARVLELEGMLLYRAWVFGRADGRTLSAILDTAAIRFTGALRHNRDSHRAWAGLSAVHYTRGEYREAHGAAQLAIERDYFLHAVSENLNRAFLAAFNSGDDDMAGGHCREIEQSVHGFSAVHCALLQMGWGAQPPDTARARALVARFRAAEAPASPYPGRAEAMLAAVHAAAGDASEATRLLQALNDSGDPELPLFIAAALQRLGQRKAAESLLVRFVAGNPDVRRTVLTQRWVLPGTGVTVAAAYGHRASSMQTQTPFSQ